MRTLFVGIAAALAAAQSNTPAGAQLQNAGARNAIVGRVTASDGTPARGAVVTLLERVTVRGRPQVRFVDVRLQIDTDADGRYTIPQARIGEFLVAAIPRNPQRGPDGRPNRSGHRITYHPSAAAAEQATPVMVNVREAQTADIRLIAAPLALVSGTVFDSKDTPVPNAQLHLAHGDRLYGIDNSVAVVRPNGTFAFAGMPPGTYYLQYREGTWPPARGEIGLVSTATVVVDGRDVTGVRVVALRPARVEGTLIVAPGDRAQLPPDLTVNAVPIDFEGNPGPRPPGKVNADLTFAFDTWPGPSSMRVSAERSGWTIARVRYRGADVTDSGVDFKAGEKATGVEIELVRGR